MSRVLLSALYPLNCLSCKTALVRSEKEFCISCYCGFKPLDFVTEKHNPIAQLFWGKANIHYATAVYDYIKSEKLSRLIQDFKYNSNKKIGKQFGKIMANFFLEINQFKEVDIVTFVPMHKKKKRKRGYNQAEELAISFSKNSQIPIEKLIFRTENTLTQTEKDVYSRFENMIEKFEVFESNKKFKHILIIDDVITTGATLIACIDLLKAKFNCNVSVFTLAYRDI
jgi:ComF family protein